jgi:phage baseplate assembly protein W
MGVLLAEHFSYPLRLTSTGSFATNDIDSPEDVADSLGLLAATRTGERLSVPGYGTAPSLTSGFLVDDFRSAVFEWEPRAEGLQVEVEVVDDQVTVNVSAGS